MEEVISESIKETINESFGSVSVSGSGQHHEITVGCMVEVVARTWPGINKIGGVARVTKCHYSIDTEVVTTTAPQLTHIDVRYVVMGGRERRVAIEYCRRAPQYEINSSDREVCQEEQPIHNPPKRVHLRDRSLMLGRCKKCGSLRMDCGSCDWLEDQQRNMERTRRTKLKGRKRDSQQQDDDFSDSSTSSDRVQSNKITDNKELDSHSESSISADDLFKRVHKAYSRLKALQRKEDRLKRRARSHQRENISSLEKIDGSEIHLTTKRIHRSKRSTLQVQSSGDEDSLLGNGPVFSKKVSKRLDKNEKLKSDQYDSTIPMDFSSDDSSMCHGGSENQERMINGSIRDTSTKSRKKESTKIGIVRDCDIGDMEDEEEVYTHNRESKLFDTPRSDIDKDDYSYDWDDQSDWSDYLDFGFIQPEGESAANTLPRDIIDQTEGLSYDDVAQLFRSKSKELLEKTLPKAYECLSYFQSKLNSLNNADIESISNKAQVLYSECFDSYEDMCRLMVEYGIDQCRLALKKILKRHKAEGVSVLCNRDIEEMDCGFDALQSKIEDALRNFRLTLASFQNLVNDRNAPSEEEDEGLTNSSTERLRIDKGDGKNVDPHPHATRKRRGRLLLDDAVPERRAGRRRRTDMFLDKGSAGRGRNTIAKLFEAEGRLLNRENAGSSLGLECNDAHSMCDSSAQNEPFFKIYNQKLGNPNNRARRGDSKGHESCAGSRIRREGGHGKINQASNAASRADILSCNRLFEMLKNSAHVDDTVSLGPDILTIDILEICNILSDKFFVASVRNNILSKLPIYFREMRGKHHSTKNSSKVVLTTLFNLIQKHGTASFVEMISCSDEKIIPCFQLFTCLLNLTAMNLQAHLEECDGKVFRILKVKKQETIETILLLLIDVLYSIILPDLWGDPDPIKPSLFRELSRLSIALGKNVPIIETMARLIMVKFGCQCWYQGFRNSNLVHYVSSANPLTLRLFWSDQGDADAIGYKIRWELLDKTLSRREIDALWTILAFFGNCGTAFEASSSFRWKLIMTLLDTPAGVFGSNLHVNYERNPHAPPSDIHMKACIREIRHLCFLLSSGALDPLQVDNALVIKVFQSCVHLEHHRALYYKYVRNRIEHVSRKSQKSVEYLWQESDIVSKSGFTEQLTAVIEELSEFYYGDRPIGIFSLASDSVLLRASLHFIKLWIQRHPDKRARWLRLNDSIYIMINTCQAIGSAMTSPKSDNVSDKFQSLFSDSICSSSLGAGPSFLREAIVSLLLCVALTRLKCTFSSSTQDTLPLVAKLDMLFCKQVWSYVANKEMALAQESLYNQKEEGNVLNLSMSFHETSSVSKVIIALILLFLKKPAKELDIIEYLAACLLTCLAAASNSLAKSRQTLGDSLNTSMQAEVIFRMSYWVNFLMNVLAKDQSQNGQSKQCVIMILSVFQKVIIKMLQIPSPGNPIDWAFRCYLSSIRSSVLILIGASHPDRVDELVTGTSVNENAFIDCDRDTVVFIRNLFQDLLGLLADSAPSSRFTLHRATRSSDSCSKQSPLGREVVARHSGGVASTLAALVNALGLEANSLILSAEFSLPHFSDDIHRISSGLSSQPRSTEKRGNFTSEGNTFAGQLSREDIIFYKRIGYVYSSEICRLAKYHVPCRRLVLRNYSPVVESFLNAMVDADILACFPITDYGIVFIAGDESCVTKEKERREIMLESVDARVDGLYQHDSEALGIKKGYGEIFDSPGPSNISKRIWSFGIDIGHVLTFAENRMEALCAAFLRSSAETNSVIVEAVEALPRTSLERECIRRSIKVRAILSALSTEHGLLLTTIGKRLFSTMLRQLDSVTAAIKYLRRSEDETKIYDLSKALALYFEYGVLCLDILSWILIRSRFLHEGPIKELSEWLWEHIISITAKESSHRLNIFFLLNEIRIIIPEGLQSHSQVVQHYLRTLLFYISSSSDQQFFYRNTHMILDTSLVHLKIEEISSLLLETESNSIANSIQQTSLSDFLIHLDLVTRRELSGYEERWNLAGISFRLQAFRHFLSKVRLSISYPNEDREKIFAVLQDIISKNLELDMNIDANRSGLFLICELIGVLNSLFVNALLQYQDNLLALIYQTFIFVMNKNTKSGMGFLKSMRSSVLSKVEAQYLTISFELIQLTSRIITESSTRDTLSSFIIQIDNIAKNGEMQNALLLDDDPGDILRRWTLLYQEKIALEMTLNIQPSNCSIQKSTKNPYAKKSQSNTTFTQDRALDVMSINFACLFLKEYASLET